MTRTHRPPHPLPLGSPWEPSGSEDVVTEARRAEDIATRIAPTPPAVRFTVEMNRRRLVVPLSAAVLAVAAAGALATLLPEPSSLPPVGSARSTLLALGSGVLSGEAGAVRDAAPGTTGEEAVAILDTCADVSRNDLQFDVFDELVPTSAHAYLAGASRSAALNRSACEVWISWGGDAWTASAKPATASPTSLPTR